MTAWTQAEEATLREMAAAGQSSVAISRQLGRARNAVCGRARRLGVKFNAIRKPEMRWVSEARKLIASGMSISAAARALGKAETSLRIALDINGARAKAMEASKRAKARSRAQLKGEEQVAPYVSRHAKQIELATKNDRLATENAYSRPEPVKCRITLPAISIPEIIEPPRTFRLAPKVKVSEAPGVSRWREAHRAMVRAGKVAGNDLTAEWVR